MNKQDLLDRYRSFLTMRNYRPQTKRSYMLSLIKFLKFCQIHSEIEGGISDYCRSYIVHRFDKGLAWSSVNIDYSALRILCVEVLHIEWNYKLIPRPRGRPGIPDILSGRQVERMLNLTSNLKHKTILGLMYATGLRISEVINLDLKHIMLDRKQLKVFLGKGGKDRLIPLPDTFIKLLVLYISVYHPKTNLFEGADKKNRYSLASIRKITLRAGVKAGVAFSVNPHSIRYAYATHHIENGTDLVTLQNLLGHSNINTTIKYVNLCHSKPRHLNHPIQRLDIDLKYKIRSVKSLETLEKIT